MIRIAIKRQLGDFTLEADFQDEVGGLIALFGRSGSGKTSVINAISGLLTPDSGDIEIDGTKLFSSTDNTNLPPEKRRVGTVFQDGRLFPHLDVRRNLLYGAKRNGNGPFSLDAAVSLLELEPLLSRHPISLSGGEKQRVAIGRALMANPRILLMDEPLSALDGARKADILPAIEKLRDEAGIPIIYVSHAMEEVARLADTMVILDAGRVAAVGSVEDLTSRLDLRPLTGRYEAGSVLAVEVADVDRTMGLASLAFTGGRLTVAASGLEPGMSLKIRLRARDVAIARAPVEGISIQNQLPGTILEIAAVRDGGAQLEGPLVDVLIDVGAPLWARITRKSREALELMPGMPVTALVKTVAIDRASVGSFNRSGK